MKVGSTVRVVANSMVGGHSIWPAKGLCAIKNADSAHDLDDAV